MRRQFRIVVAIAAIISLLLMQLALASYQCASYRLPAADAAQTMAMTTTMPNCHGMDHAQPALCHAHASGDVQSLDKPDVPAPSPFVAALLLLVLALSPLLSDAARRLPMASSFRRPPGWSPPGAPPLAIRLCCFRI